MPALDVDMLSMGSVVEWVPHLTDELPNPFSKICVDRIVHPARISASRSRTKCDLSME